MAESLSISPSLGKKERYVELFPQLRALLEGESDVVAGFANTAAALHAALRFFWVGFYFVKGNELVLGPFQGTVACSRIAFGKGVCGKAWETKQAILVPDVDAFPGHIACSSLSRSEIVIPLLNSKKEVVAVLDVDSDKTADFDVVDEQHLREITMLLEKMFYA